MRPLLGAGVALLLLSAPAFAQLHAHIDAHAVVEFDQGMIVALRMGWKFEPDESRAMVASFDADADGSLSQHELAAMERETFAPSRRFGYFTHAAIDGAPLDWPEASQFRVMTFEDSLVYGFRLALPQPVDPRRQSFGFAVYDEDFRLHVDFPNAAAVKLIGEGAAGCHAEISPDREYGLYGGRVVPNRAAIACDP